jgi:hypothetical protein
MSRPSMRHVPAQRTVSASAVVFLGTLLVSCATTQSRFTPLGPVYPPRPGDCGVAVLKDSVPQKAFERVSRLDVHLERTGFAQGDFESALPELKKQACLSGADAIIEIEERSTGFRLENRAYHVTATGIKFRD